MGEPDLEENTERMHCFGRNSVTAASVNVEFSPPLPPGQQSVLYKAVDISQAVAARG